MVLYQLDWQSEAFGEVSSFTHQPSLEMAYNFASKKLQAMSNTMFYQVDVYAADDPGLGLPLEVRRCELVATRGTQELPRG